MRPLHRLIQFWMSLNTPVDRRAYLLNGIGLASVKYLGDLVLVWYATGQLWTPLDYLRSLSLLSAKFVAAPPLLLPLLGFWALPFIWLGITLTVRRLQDADHSCWLAFLFFVPFLNYLLMAVSAMLPTEPRRNHEYDQRSLSRQGFTPAVIGLTVGLAAGIGAVTLAVSVFYQYAATLFFGAPFLMGALTAFFFNRQYRASRQETLWVATLMFVVSAGLTFLIAAEGAICILMAFPLALITGLLGALVGRSIAQIGQSQAPPAFLALLILPLAAIAEPPHTGRLLHEVQSSVEIDATPEKVWPHVIAFSPIKNQPEFLFRLGLSYPKYARIDGEGVGAVRYCVFSTGAFVEPITRWENARRLSFDVVQSPAPLRELTFYKDVSPPHLDGYLRSKRGEFRLTPLPGGRTRLEGSTWYELEMSPEGYWQVFTDYLIGRIHQRVLTHIKSEVER